MEEKPYVEVGQSSGPLSMRISADWNKAYREATGDKSTPQTDAGKPIAPPMMAALIGRRSMSWIPVPPGAVHAKQSYKFHRPLPVDEKLIVESTILDIFERRGKNYLVIGMRVTDSTGTLIGEGNTTRVNTFNAGDTK